MRISDWSSDVCSSDLLSADALKTLHDALDAQRDINRRLDIANFIRVPVVVRAKIVADPARVADEVQAAASKALLDHFAFEAMPLGRSIHASDIFAVLQGALGVVAVEIGRAHVYSSH